MANRYNRQPSLAGATRFNKSPMAEVEFSKMTAKSMHLTTFNGGDIVPVGYWEVLPHSTFEISADFVTRLQTALRPTMGDLIQDIHFVWIPNRIINDSWKNVQGENTSGVWAAPEVDLAPLYSFGSSDSTSGSIKVPCGSVADYYGFPTQAPIPSVVIAQMNDLKFRGYLEAYNFLYRDENWQPPVPYSKLNVYNGFMEPKNTSIYPVASSANTGINARNISASQLADGSYPKGSIVKAIAGEGGKLNATLSMPSRLTSFSALDKPLKANKLHDVFTSSLPAPQKGSAVTFSVSGEIPVYFDTASLENAVKFPSGNGLNLLGDINLGYRAPLIGQQASSGGVNGMEVKYNSAGSVDGALDGIIDGWNITGKVDLADSIGVSINDLRTSIATQQVLEILARGGSRYVSVLANMFDIETANPYVDVPQLIGHIRRTLDMYQVAQTSATAEGGTPQGTLTAYGYTTNGGKGFTKTFIEHGYIHAFLVVRQKNLYSSYLAPDNFRKGTLDFYMPPLANISEQPVMLRTLNPFQQANFDAVLGYQEAWWEYRHEVDKISGEFRSNNNPSIAGFESLDMWHYGDNLNQTFMSIDGEWMKSNAEEVINRTIAVKSDLAHQFKTCIVWTVTKQIPMPTYSVPGLDQI